MTLPPQDPDQMESQRILHAVEELYYLRRYVEAVKIVDEALRGIVSSSLRDRLVEYRQRCEEKGKEKSSKNREET